MRLLFLFCLFMLSCPNIIALIGDNCSDPIIIEYPNDFPFMDAGQTTCGRGNDYESTCLGLSDGGEDIIYEISLNQDIYIMITLDPLSDGYLTMAMGLSDQCPFPDEPETCFKTVVGSQGTTRTLYLTSGIY